MAEHHDGQPTVTSGSPPLTIAHSSFRGRIGVARGDITPPVGIYARNWGAAEHDVAESIHQPLTLTALTLSADAEESPLVLIDADLGWWRPLAVFKQMQRRLLEALALEPSRLIFSLTHTHAAPPLAEADPLWPGGDLLADWLEMIFQTTVDTVKRALENATETILDWHRGCCQLAAMRDLPDPTFGKNRLLCGYNPQGRADDTLLVGRVTDRDGTVRASLVNYACHPTTLAWENRAISPDFVGAMRETIEAATGGAPALFLQGASGDLAPRHQYVGDHSVADRHGRGLGFAALATSEDMQPPATRLAFESAVESGAPLAVWRPEPIAVSNLLRAVETTVDLPLKNWPSAAELERERLDCTDRAREERLRRKRDIRRQLGDGETFALPITAWRMGDAVLVGCMAECYSQLQQQLRRHFPDRAVICMNLINGSIGYLPPEELYDIDVYQVWQTPFARGSLETITDAMIETIEQLLGSASRRPTHRVSLME